MQLIHLIGFIVLTVLPVGNYCCPIICFYQPTDRIVDCVVKPNPLPANSQRLQCRLGSHFQAPVMRIGSGELLGRFQPRSLDNLTFNSIAIPNLYLNVSLQSINANSFGGYFRNINSVFVYAVDEIRSNTFARMPHLRELQIENMSRKSIPTYLIVDSTNINRKMYLRMNAICYSCPDLRNSNDNRVYFEIVSDMLPDKSVIYSNISLAKCREKYVEGVCGGSVMDNSQNVAKDASQYDSMRNKFWIILFFSLVTFVMIIVLVLVLFCIRKRYQRNLRLLKSQYVANVLHDGKSCGLNNPLLVQ